MDPVSDNRSIVYHENGNTIYRASAVGSCIKALVAAGLGYQEHRPANTSDILDLAAEEGNLHEDAIIDRLAADGYRFDPAAQQVIEIRVIPNVYIRGHIDGIVKPPKAQHRRVFEAKSMSKDRFKRWKAGGFDQSEFFRYAVQISCYMEALGMNAVYAVKDRNSGELDIQELKTPPIAWDYIKRKVITAQQHILREKLPDCVASSGEKYFCAFGYLHDEDYGEHDDGEVDHSTQTLIAEFAAEHHKLGQEIKRLEALQDERREIGKRMLNLIGEHGPKYVSAGGYKVTRVDSSRKVVLDEDLAHQLGIDVEKLKEAKEAATTKRSIIYPKVTVDNGD